VSVVLGVAQASTGGLLRVLLLCGSKLSAEADRSVVLLQVNPLPFGIDAAMRLRQIPPQSAAPQSAPAPALGATPALPT
jgi:hypothetical protein